MKFSQTKSRKRLRQPRSAAAKPATVLVLSIGNTSLFGGAFSPDWRIAPFRLPAADLLSLPRYVPKQVHRAVVCSVVPALTPDVLRFIRRTWNVEPSVLTADSRHGLTIGYRNPRDLGTDRLAAAIGARAAFPKRNIIVVDCGTATTITALRQDGRILGGAILPGLSLWSDMLARGTAQLPRIELRRPRMALGRSPEEAIASGIYFGHVGAIREMVQRVRREAFGQGRCVVVGTGGHAPQFTPEKLFTVIEPNLILQGLHTFADNILTV